MTFSLRLLNLIVGLCSGTAALPRELFGLGFRVQRIEHKVPIGQPIGSTKKEIVVPEVVISSEEVQHTILFEWKSGKNTEAEQLERYSKVTSDDLVKESFFSPLKCTNIDIAVVCEEENQKWITIGIKDKYTFPVMVKFREGLKTVLNTYKVDRTDALFRPLKFDWDQIPTVFFPLDKDSELWEFAEFVIPTVLEDMQRNRTMVLASSVAARIIPFWDSVGADYKKELSKRIAEVLDRAAKREFKKYLRKNTGIKSQTSTPTWDITENPLVGVMDKRTKGWRTLRKLQTEFLDHLRNDTLEELMQLTDDVVAAKPTILEAATVEAPLLDGETEAKS